ncbi:MAG: 30S ribosomal protein S17 [Syntrophobacteraceae bacterium]
MEEKAKLRKTREGIVVSSKMEKTVVVAVDRLIHHPQYRKFIRRRNKFKAHDELNACGVGDRVLIEESRPISKDKRWNVIQVLQKASI